MDRPADATSLGSVAALRDALGRLVKYSHLINALPDFHLEDTEDTVDLVVTVPDYGPAFSPAATDAGLAIFLRMCLITAGDDIMPVHVTMQVRAPSSAGRASPPVNSDHMI